MNDIYKTQNQIVTFSDNMKKFDEQIKKFLRQKMYFNSKVNSRTNYGRKVISKLFTKIKKKPQVIYQKSKVDHNFNKLLSIFNIKNPSIIIFKGKLVRMALTLKSIVFVWKIEFYVKKNQ